MASFDEKLAINKRCRMSELIQVIVVDYPSRRVKGWRPSCVQEGALRCVEFVGGSPFAEFL